MIKRIMTLIATVALLLTYVACEKDDDQTPAVVNITTEVSMEGRIVSLQMKEEDSNKPIEKFRLQLSENYNFSPMQVYECEEEEKRFTLPYLQNGKVYYYRYVVSNASDYMVLHDVNSLVAEFEEVEGTTYTVNGVTFKMVYVAGGTFMMGATSEQFSDASDNELPAHRVTLSDYYMGETEVTQALWESVMGTNPSICRGQNNMPVESVSWDDCQTFVRKLKALTGADFRLPTEAEWEYAARGGSKSRGYKYSGNNKIGDIAWYEDNSSSKTHPVVTKRPNELGLYDMSGNVYEWCSDWYGSYSSFSSTNPMGPSSGSGRVIRGGGWFSDAGNCRVSIRFNGNLDYRDNAVGLRLALSSHP